MNKIRYIRVIFIFVLLFLQFSFANKPFRLGTTSANFLEIGYGAAGIAMGDAYVSMVHDLSSVYWNPAGLAFMDGNETFFMHQPWLVGSELSMVAVGIPIDGIGTMAFSIIHMGYGDEPVTTMAAQDGTGEIYDANEISATFSYGRAITDWFAFGIGLKYVSSQIWHTSASALAFDFGVLIKTEFLDYSGNNKNGMRIGMSVSNYGTPMKYDGLDLINPIDISSDNGNFSDVPGQFRLRSWELPLVFRVGVSAKPIVIGNQSITTSIDVLHPNNNSESVNTGIEYEVKMDSFGSLFLRAGYKALFMEDSEYGTTFGAGFKMNLLGNVKLRLDYAHRDMGIWGSKPIYEFHIVF